MPTGSPTATEPAEELLRRRLADLDEEMARLTALRDQMVAIVEALPSQDCPPPLPGSWCPPDNEGGDDSNVRDHRALRLRPRVHRSLLRLRLLMPSGR